MIRFFTLCLLSLLCSSCIQLGGEPEPTRYYLLAPLAETAVDINRPDLHVSLGPIEIPSYLDRPQIVTRTTDSEIVLANHDRWAEPLPENFIRTLQENLYQQLGNVSITTTPWSPNSKTSYRITLALNRFDGVIDQQTNVDIRWSLLDATQNKELQRGQFRAEIPINGSYPEFVNGLNIALAEFSEGIAAVLRKQLFR